MDQHPGATPARGERDARAGVRPVDIPNANRDNCDADWFPAEFVRT